MTTHKIIIGDSRGMPEVDDGSVRLVVTSPPYWQLKDYGAKNQIGFHNDYRDYINNLNLVWEESWRVLAPGCRLCVNIGDQFARAAHYGRYKVIPIRAEIVRFCEWLGFDYMGAIIWQKVTTCNTSGGATIMGSFPFPRNGIVKIDYEFILLFKKPGKTAPPSEEAKEAARLTTDEWNEYFYGHWNFPGERGGEHLAAFPLELPARLIRMFTFPGETVLDPFLGSGTTSLAALRLDRDSVGYEINPEFLPIIEKKVCREDDLLDSALMAELKITEREGATVGLAERIERWADMQAHVPAAFERVADPREKTFGSRVSAESPRAKGALRLREVEAPNRVRLSDGRAIVLLGVEPWTEPNDETRSSEAACAHLQSMIWRSGLTISGDNGEAAADVDAGYVHLANRKFVNARMIRDGYARADRTVEHRHRKRFEKYEDEARAAGRGFWSAANDPAR